MRAMPLDPDSCYRALAAHDARFDGRFFVGVSSTRIYCRPVCTVRMPRRENCRFFPSAAAAEVDGFRPCLRCRPELAPGNAERRRDGAARAGRGRPDRGRRARRRRHRGARRARRRHQPAPAARSSTREFGVSPIEYAQTQRLLLAKRLLTDTALPVTEVALASGFASLRRFNALFKDALPDGAADGCARAAPRVRCRRALALRARVSGRPTTGTRCSRSSRARAIAGVEAVDAATLSAHARARAPRRAHAGLDRGPPRRRASLRCASACRRRSRARFPRCSRASSTRSTSPAIRSAIAAALGTLARSAPRACASRARSTASSWRCARSSASRSRCARARTLLGRIAAAFGAAARCRCRAGGLTRLFPPAGALAALRARSSRGSASRARARGRSIALARRSRPATIALDARRRRRARRSRSARRAARHRHVDRAATSRCARWLARRVSSPTISSC